MHTSTLAALAAGIRDAGRRLGDRAAQDHADRLTRRLLGGEFTLAEAFVRSPGDTRVDGSLLWLGVPVSDYSLDASTTTRRVARQCTLRADCCPI